MTDKIKAIIFDFDGVVVDSEPLYKETGRELFRQYGVEISDKHWQEFKGLTARDFFGHAKKKYNLSADIEEIATADDKILKFKFQEKLDYIAGFRKFFESVKKEYKTALVTSTSRQLLNWIYTHTKIEDHFQETITADDVQNPKPHPQPYLEIAKKLKICPTSMIVLEDSINGVISAKAAGSKVIGFLTSFDKIILKDADYFALNYAEVQAIIDRFF
ncbi:MAG: HAD family phosphatase [Candidatus Marinimicrobia bacterium]|nr:HAD family phosphatase [Candidatus Neomarinimicrobiota bacterium]